MNKLDMLIKTQIERIHLLEGPMYAEAVDTLVSILPEHIEKQVLQFKAQAGITEATYPRYYLYVLSVISKENIEKPEKRGF